jgi:hypothetical protein
MTRPGRTLGFLAALLTLGAIAAPAPGGADEGFVSLFNGKDLSGWRGDARHWSVADGTITGTTTPATLLKSNTFLIWEGGKPSDFELRLSYRIVGGNSGVQYRSRVLDDRAFVVSGYQADIDSSGQFTGINYEERGRGVLAQRGEKVEIARDGTKRVAAVLGDKDALHRKVKNEDWNEYVIIARGNHLRHIINGVPMSEVIDHQTEKAAKSGVIALQLHQGPPMTVQFKDIRLKELR